MADDDGKGSGLTIHYLDGVPASSAIAPDQQASPSTFFNIRIPTSSAEMFWTVSAGAFVFIAAMMSIGYLSKYMVLFLYDHGIKQTNNLIALTSIAVFAATAAAVWGEISLYRKLSEKAIPAFVSRKKTAGNSTGGKVVAVIFLAPITAAVLGLIVMAVLSHLEAAKEWVDEVSRVWVWLLLIIGIQIVTGKISEWLYPETPSPPRSAAPPAEPDPPPELPYRGYTPYLWIPSERLRRGRRRPGPEIYLPQRRKDVLPLSNDVPYTGWEMRDDEHKDPWFHLVSDDIWGRPCPFCLEPIPDFRPRDPDGNGCFVCPVCRHGVHPDLHLVKRAHYGPLEKVALLCMESDFIWWTRYLCMKSFGRICGCVLDWEYVEASAACDEIAEVSNYLWDHQAALATQEGDPEENVMKTLAGLKQEYRELEDYMAPRKAWRDRAAALALLKPDPKAIAALQLEIVHGTTPHAYEESYRSKQNVETEIKERIEWMAMMEAQGRSLRP